MSVYKKYRKKPIIIKAKKLEEPTVIKTLEGDMKGDVGDFLVIGIQGEKYIVKNEIFKKTYELV